MRFSRLLLAALLVPTLALAQAQEAAPPQGAPPPPPAYPPPPPSSEPPPARAASPVYSAEPVYPAPPRLRPRLGLRDSWYIGFGLGTGDGRVSQGGTDYSFDGYQSNGSPTNVFLNFKLGATLSPQLLLGLDVSAIRSATSGNGITTGVQVLNYDAVVTWFPMETGVFLRGGVGLTSLTLDANLSGYGSATKSYGGGNVLVGVGYAWWMGRSFNLTANLDFSAQSYGGKSGDPERTSFWALWLGFDWY